MMNIGHKQDRTVTLALPLYGDAHSYQRTSEPACNGVCEVTPTALLLKIFSTAVNPCPSIEVSFDSANTLSTYFV